MRLFLERVFDADPLTIHIDKAFLQQFSVPRDVEAPLAGPSRQACRAARGVGLSAISAILGHEVVLRANGVIVVQRAVVRNADVRGKIQYGARQTMDMMVMHTRHADLSKQRGEHGIVVRQGKV